MIISAKNFVVKPNVHFFMKCLSKSGCSYHDEQPNRNPSFIIRVPQNILVFEHHLLLEI